MKIEEQFTIGYHGTSDRYAERIRYHGFKFDQKGKNGATKIFRKLTQQNDRIAKKHHYISTSITEAASYAKLHKNPEIVRIVCLTSWLNTKDTEAGTNTAFRINRDIPKEHILPKAKSDLTQSKINNIQTALGTKNDIYEYLTTAMSTPQEDGMLINKAKSFIKEAEAANEQRLEDIKKSGVSLHDLKEGDIICL